MGKLRADTPVYARWRRLHLLLANLERAFEAACRLDALDAQVRESLRQHQFAEDPARAADQLAERFERRLDWITAAMRKEVNRLTIERLQADLARRRAG